jgi:hypothetical protein
MVHRTLSIKKTLIGLSVMTLLMSTGCKPKLKGIDLNEYRSAVEQTALDDLLEPDSVLEKEALKRFDTFYAVYSVDAIKTGIRQLYAADAWFGDPFHQVQGIDAIENYFLAMAEPVETCTFSIDSMQRSGTDYYARWTMVLKSKAIKGEPIEALGFSHVRFNKEGLIIFQQDYWDTSALFDRVPVVGYWTRLAKGRIEKGLK